MKFDWISVNEKIPDYDKQVLIWAQGRVVIAALVSQCLDCGQDDHFNDGTYCYDLETAAHWVNVPKGPAPKEKEIRITTKKRRPLNNNFNTALKKPRAKSLPNKYNFWG